MLERIDIRVEKLRILYILDDISLFGAAQSLLDMIVGIKEKVVPIIIMRGKSALEKKFEQMMIKYYTVEFETDHVLEGTVNEKKEVSNFINNYDAAKRIAQIIRQECVQLIHINSSVSNVGAFAALMENIPFIWHIRELVDEHYGYEFLNWPIKKMLFDRADCLLAISEYVRTIYKEKYGLDSLRLYNGITEERYSYDINERSIFEQVFLIVGAVTPQKGQFDAIRAIGIVKQKYEKVQLVIVGSGSEVYMWGLKKYVHTYGLENNVCFVGFQKDLSILRKKAGYSLTCSKSEALGRVTVEAMYAGNFVIGARSGGTTEIIGENESRGLLYEYGNYVELANTMISAIEMSLEQKRKMIFDAQKYVRSNFGIDNYCNQLTELYSEKILMFSKEKDIEFLENIKNRRETLKEKSFNKQDTMSPESLLKAQKAFKLSIEWLKIRQGGRKLEEYFTKLKIHTIAIYGMADLGRCLYDELENSSIDVKYVIDKNPGIIGDVLKFSVIEKEKIFVDMIVVTVAAAEQLIVKEIKDKGYANVIGLSDIFESMKNDN